MAASHEPVGQSFAECIPISQSAVLFKAVVEFLQVVLSQFIKWYFSYLRDYVIIYPQGEKILQKTANILKSFLI